MFRVREGGAWLRVPHPLVALPIALALPGVRASVRQVGPYSRWWDGRNADALAAGSPHWVVLGDSAAQGVGAPAPDAGWAGQLERRLRDAGCLPGHLLNLSRSGARLRDVIDTQLPRMRALAPAPALVTCAVGVNDLLRTKVAVACDQARELVAALPAGAVLSTLPQGLRSARAAALNRVLEEAAPAAGVVLADLWRHTAPPFDGRFARDGFHRNARGYIQWADAFAEAVLARPARGSAGAGRWGP